MALARARAVEAENKIHRAHHRISQNFPCFRRGHQWSDFIRAFEKGLGAADDGGGGSSGDWSAEVVSKPEEVDEESRTRSFYFRQVMKACFHSVATLATRIQGSAKRLRLGCVNAAGKLRQEW